MHWMCVLYQGESIGCAGPARSRRGYLPADPCTEAAVCWAWPHRLCRTGAHGRTCWCCCDAAVRAGVAA